MYRFVSLGLKPPRFWDNWRTVDLICVRCSQRISKMEEAYADLNGDPFDDYYHARCAAEKAGY